MTTPNDNLKNRSLAADWGEGKEQTVGVPIDGFADPTGEFPKRDYFYGSSINKGARGGQRHQVWRGGGDIDLSVYVPDQPAAVYPYNDINETASGHVVEYDDTPGGERILIKHRTGAGVEMRADGTVVVSATNNKIEVTGADHTAIIHGKGDIVYKGSLNLTVTGDYNVNVGGNHNVNVAGNSNVDIYGSHEHTVINNSSTTVGGVSDSRVGGNSTEVTIGDRVQAIRGTSSTLVQGDIEARTGGNMAISAEGNLSTAAINTSIISNHLNAIAAKGFIGGANVQYEGSVYTGLKDAGTGEPKATFIGSVIGRATEATTAEFAQKADQAYTAFAATNATRAATAVTEGGPPPDAFDASTITSNPDYKMNLAHKTSISYTDYSFDDSLVGILLAVSEQGIKKVEVDDANSSLLNAIRYSDNYQGVIDHIPTTAEIRSILRDPNNRSNTELIAALAAEQRLSSNYLKVISQFTDPTTQQQNSIIPYEIGRTNKQEDPVGRFGYNNIGNNPMENKSKRFKPAR